MLRGKGNRRCPEPRKKKSPRRGWENPADRGKKGAAQWGPAAPFNATIAIRAGPIGPKIRVCRESAA